MIFDGKAFAKQRELLLAHKNTKLMVVLDPNNASGSKYVELKGKMAQRLGIGFEVFEQPQIEKWNKDPQVGGIMIQMPYPNSNDLIKQIDPKKDVDGLREDSPFVPATVRAVLEILKAAKGRGEVVVVGDKGVVGRSLVKVLSTQYSVLGMDKADFDPGKLKKADVIISATGQAGLIKPEMVKEQVVAIDVGYPKGDFDPSTALRASFFTPVPGGVGPVTVVCLFENLLKNTL